VCAACNKPIVKRVVGDVSVQRLCRATHVMSQGAVVVAEDEDDGISALEREWHGACCASMSPRRADVCNSKLLRVRDVQGAATTWVCACRRRTVVSEMQVR
jgi:hypothetical protein